ncbi:GNAT family N-acetyltransferase [Rhodococcus sp. 05-2254-5]|uniref:GNAT family N-acetyltransferase n=1 Tax=Nocardiaceae TaxID=85025 RepID=UPI0009B8BDE2|nr:MULTISPECIES: GNAT family N-acetyltransferase [Rhodococcus]OZE38288.1 GNAT family N-acetyltransferase [Rhodococcus sp. 05-2254-5]OZE56756.1 GNAT family N-acetyltransferase [Rhodococcus sp. 05-2254-1]
MELPAYEADRFDPHRLDIVRLAWCRRLSLDDRALDTTADRVEHRTDTENIVVLRLAQTTLIVGPSWAVDAARGIEGQADTGRTWLSTLLGDRVEQYEIDSHTLAYGSEIGHTIDVHDPLISHDAEHARALAEHCSEADVTEAFGEPVSRHWFTLLGDDRPADSARSLASAGYSEENMILADMRVLTDPDHRRHGHAAVVGRLATNDAIDDGLIPQWRARPENTTARRLAARLDYVEIGACHTAVRRT